ncbi:MAG: response regulator [Candidatus Krumholzibacteriia bacterium]
MTDQPLPKVLCVDDEEKLLNAIRRTLHKRCDIHTASGGEEGLKVLEAEGPFEVVVSDMKMPGMNGAEFLRHVRRRSPDTVRLLLTGFADLDTVVTAVNEGYIYRFLGKPCTGQVLWEAIQDARNQHLLITSQKVLLEQTLKGCIKALTEILSMAAPAAFGRATRICHLSLMLAQELGYDETWQVEVAAMLSQLACITLPPVTALKVYKGEKLTDQELAMVARMPVITEQILAGIPRLEEVMAILEERDLDFAPEENEGGLPDGADIAPGARILRVANDLEVLQAQGETAARCVDLIRTRKRLYDPAVVDAYERLAKKGGLDFRTRGLTVEELRTGMMLSDDVVLTSGAMLVPKGQEITVGLLERIKNFDQSGAVAEPIWVRVPEHELAPVPLDTVAAAEPSLDEVQLS